MKKFISLSKYPGKTGKYFYTEFFKHYQIDAVYEPRACDDIQECIAIGLEDGVAGISVSMPFKQNVITHLHSRSPSVSLYNSCNTIVNDQGNLTGYNADLAGVEYACKNIKISDRVTILGAGAIGSMFVKYLEDSHYDNLNICARSLNTWNNRYKPAEIIINCTALGTSTDESPYRLGQIPPDTRLVIDLAINDNEFKEQCKTYSIKYMSGREFYREQFLKQFEIYTGIKPSIEVYNEIERKQYETI
jgi:shikimate 5-dehydrogenase